MWWKRIFARPIIAGRASHSGVPAAASMMAAYSTMTVTKRKDDGLLLVPDDAKDLPHHVRTGSGKKTIKFVNPHPSYQDSTVWQKIRSLFTITWPKPTGNEMEMVPPQFLPSRTGSQSLRATWLGHACYYVEFPSGLRVLFDPVFEDHCSPVKFGRLKRYTQPPCALADLPHVDAVVISHSHYDHLSHPSVLELQRHHPNAHFFVGLGLESWFRKSGVDHVTEMDWWEDVEVSLTPEESRKGGEGGAGGEGDEKLPTIHATISCLPSQHTSGRTGFDKDTTLWCSWGIRSGGKNVWFGGDTGYRSVPELPASSFTSAPSTVTPIPADADYGPAYASLPTNPQFAQIGALRGPFDLGLIPIGAYAPRHIFSGMHANPYDSVRILRDTRCDRALAMHWGTWVMTPEELLEPPRLLRDALEKAGLPAEGVFDICKVGETREF